jgi:hypothetical protein
MQADTTSPLPRLFKSGARSRPLQGSARQITLSIGPTMHIAIRVRKSEQNADSLTDASASLGRSLLRLFVPPDAST